MVEKKPSLCFVTGNSNKFKEVSEFFKSNNIKFDLTSSNAEPLEIQAENLEEIALFKLKSVKKKVNGSFFVEDAGFFVDEPLKGFPGVYSSFVLEKLGCEGILKLISDFDEAKAHFSAVIALYYKPLNESFVFEGNVHGKVASSMRGSGGFGFDPIFIPHEKPNRTFAELSPFEKNSISHRGRALEKLVDFLKKQQ